MPYERLIGLNVHDDLLYAEYRKAMSPILIKYGGSFRYDFRIAEVLKSETSNPINRVFILGFPDRASKDAFFSDPAYIKVREEFYDKSVREATVLAEIIR